MKPTIEQQIKWLFCILEITRMDKKQQQPLNQLFPFPFVQMWIYVIIIEPVGFNRNYFFSRGDEQLAALRLVPGCWCKGCWCELYFFVALVETARIFQFGPTKQVHSFNNQEMLCVLQFTGPLIKCFASGFSQSPAKTSIRQQCCLC